MEKDQHITKVVFRKFESDKRVIAIFPEVAWTPLSCASYMTLGQHGGASFDLIIDTLPASPEEYQPLLEELESLGYNLAVYKRITSQMREARQKDYKSYYTK